MKVKDLIKELEKLPPNATVLVTSSNFELNHADVPVNHISFYKEGSKRTQTFRDAFDGESYSKETWSIIGGKLKVVKLSA